MGILDDLFYSKSSERITHQNYDKGLPPVIRTSVCGVKRQAHDAALAYRKKALADQYFKKRYGEDYLWEFENAKTGVPPPSPVDLSLVKAANPHTPVVSPELLAFAAEPIDLRGDIKQYDSPANRYAALIKAREADKAKETERSSDGDNDKQST